LWLEARGFSLTRIYGEDFHGIPEADLLIVLGSPNSVASGHCLPPGSTEIEAVATWLTTGKPYIGICFGAQVLACALGGTVRRMPNTFRGFVEVEHSPTQSYLDGRWALWHEDAITAPANAEVLASLPHADMVFRVGNAWGVQPHIEFDAGIVKRLAAAMEVSQSNWEILHDELSADEKHSLRALQLLDGILDAVQLGETCVR
jgi:GMP synthase (glutamine-hydrolysing)